MSPGSPERALRGMPPIGVPVLESIDVEPRETRRAPTGILPPSLAEDVSMRVPVFCLSGLLGLLALGSSTARAATYTVTSSADSGAGTLREAMTQAVANTGGAPHTIVFDLPTTPAVIALQTPLPTISVAMTIDGTTQSGYAGTPLVVLDGSASSNMRGLYVYLGNGTTIAGLEIRNFGLGGVQVGYSTNVTIRASDIHHNSDGIVLSNSIVTVGGANAGDRNLLHDNTSSGVSASGTCNGSRIRGNFIGTNALGSAAAPNQVGISLASDATGVAIGPGNVISGNAISGVFVNDGGSGTIEGNFIGTDATGSSAVPNTHGVYSLSPSTYVGGTAAGTRNVISGNSATGVTLAGSQGRVVGNYIGTDATGTAALPNLRGVLVSGPSTIVGGATSSHGNVISGNTLAGVEVDNAGATSVSIFQNRIGAAATGSASLGNGTGVLVSGAPAVQVGAMNAGNLIAHNDYGVQMVAGGTAVVDANSIFDHATAGISGNVLTHPPVVASAIPSGGSIGLSTSIAGLPDSPYTIQFFDSASCEAGGAGETLFGSVDVMTNGAGTTSFQSSFAGGPALGRAVTAVAILRSSATNTSAFSSCRKVCGAMTFSPATLPAATSGSSYLQTLSASGGTGAVTYAVSSGTLPAGLAIVGNAISGTPTVGASSTPITITATDSIGCSIDASFTFATTCPTIAVTPATIPAPILGVPYSQTFQASGGAPPYVFSASGALTAPLTWDPATATIAGTLTDASPSDVTIRATDALGCEGSVRVMPTAACPAITLAPNALPSGDPGTTYSAMLSATGANGAVTFALASGSLPPGVTLGTDGALAGTLSGPDAVYSFTVLATGPYACTVSKMLSITVGNPVVPSPDGGVVDTDAGMTARSSSGGCAVGGGRASGDAATIAMLLAVGLLVRRRRWAGRGVA